MLILARNFNQGGFRMCKRLFVLGLFFLFAQAAFAGSLDQTLAPTDDATRMYTLEQIYQKVTSGTAPVIQSGGFNEPSTGPSAGTMHTLDAIEAKIAAGTTTAAVGDVLATKTFITRTAGSGESAITGTMSNLTLSADSVAVPAGYYGAGSALNVVDTDLVASNIASGVTIFGIPGSHSGGSSFGIPKTGQTTSYATGDDGDLEKGTPASGASFTDTPGASNSVTDNGTGLIWVKNEATIGTVGGYNFASTMIWADALLAVAALNTANYDGSNQWRLPNVKELESIVVYNTIVPAINGSFFTAKTDFDYWCSTTFSGGTTLGWSVSFWAGVSNWNNTKATALLYVRPVRGG